MTELVHFKADHLDATFNWMQDTDLLNAFLLDKQITKIAHQQWFLNLKKDDSQEIYAIVVDSNHVGNIGLKNIDHHNRNAEAWIYIGDRDYRGKGIARSALLSMNQLCADRFNKLYARIWVHNFNSLNSFLKSDYIFEGILKAEIYFKGSFLDIIRVGTILKKN
ncbi:MAG: GNAT family N-acetyltransferase [Sphingobacteriaceae bacterium]